MFSLFCVGWLACNLVMLFCDLFMIGCSIVMIVAILRFVSNALNSFSVIIRSDRSQYHLYRHTCFCLDRGYLHRFLPIVWPFNLLLKFTNGLYVSQLCIHQTYSIHSAFPIVFLFDQIYAIYVRNYVEHVQSFCILFPSLIYYFI